MTPEALDQLDEILSLETAPAESLTDDQRRTISGIFENAEDEDQMFKLASRVEAALNEFGDNLRGRYAAAVYQELIRAEEEAGKGFLQLARALVKQNDWSGARELCLRALPLWSDARVVRLLIDSWEHLPEEEMSEEDFTLAESLCPDSPDLLWYESQRADEQGRSDEAERLAGSALRYFVSAKQPDRAEEPLLRILESSNPAVYRDLIKVIPRMAREDTKELLDTTLELAAGDIAELGLDDEFSKAIQKILMKRPAFAYLRPIYVDSLVRSLGGTKSIKEFIADCGFMDPGTPLEDALQALKEMFGLRPGAFVEHHNFGVGRIAAHDGNFLIIDFAAKPAHRMAMEIASRSLHSLPASCLRVARFSEPEKIANEIANDPAAILVRALNDLGGEVKVRDLRECLAGGTIAEEEWSNWWKTARDAAVKDDRVDTSQTYRQIYRLPTDEEDEEIELPALPAKGDAASAVRAIDRLLKHHPEWEEQAKTRYLGELVDRATSGMSIDGLAAVPRLMRWLPDRRDQWIALANKAFHLEPGVAGAVTAEEQEELLKIGLEGDAWREAAITALASRFLAIRKTALRALRERLGDQFVPTLKRVLTGADMPITQLAIIRLALANSLDEVGFTPCELLIGVTRILVNRPSPKQRDHVLELLDPHDILGEYIRERGFQEEDLERIHRVSREMASSEAGMESLIFLLSETGYRELADSLVSEAGADDDPVAMHFDPGVTLMTRMTYEQNMDKIAELQNALSNVLPQAIAAARAFGDLSENAEYHDAKERQGIADASMRVLQSTMENARIIEDMHFPDDTVAAGTEVVVRDIVADKELTFWILGQGDSVQDANVINYLAPVGQALVGKKQGDVINFVQNGHVQNLEVLSISKRLP